MREGSCASGLIARVNYELSDDARYDEDFLDVPLNSDLPLPLCFFGSYEYNRMV